MARYREIVREEFASRCYERLVLEDELVHTRSRMKLMIIGLLGDSTYHVRVKALKCLRLILRKELSTDTIKASGPSQP